MNISRNFRAIFLLSCATTAGAQSFTALPAFPLNSVSGPSELKIDRPTQPIQPFTVAGERGVLVGAQDGTFESWILPVKLLSHLTMTAEVEGYSVPIPVNAQSASIEVVPDHTTITYSHIAFTIRQIMFSPSASDEKEPGTGPVVLFQIDSPHAIDLTFSFTPEIRWMWPRRNDGIPGPEWVARQANGASGYYVLHMDYPDLAGAVTIPGAQSGILAPYQERPQVHQLELHLHYDPVRDHGKYFPLLMAVGTTAESAQSAALGQTLAKLNSSIADRYAAHAASYAKLLSESTSIETPDKALNDAFRWGVVSIEQLKAHEYATNQTGLVAGYYASGDSARPGFGWFFGRDSLYTLYAINGFGDFALSRAELEFLMARQRTDGKIMHEYSQTAADPSVNWKSFPYMYAAADSTPLFLMAMRDYLRASGDVAFVTAHRESIEKAWAFETAASSDGDNDGIYDNSQGTGWVESWPADPTAGSNNVSGMPHQEIYMALLDEQASRAFADLARAIGNKDAATQASTRAAKVQSTLEAEYYDPQKGCYAFATNPAGTAHSPVDHSSTVYPTIAWWDYNGPESPLAHPEGCLQLWNSPTIATDWGLRDVATIEPFYDGMSYHQGSVWPLFTGWGALAEYRANQPLAGQQMLMQNVDLTWAQDPGAVTELLSGDFYVPFGRSTSHQLWSSAMVVTPTLRGLFGISLDAATDTITLNPHLPADWDDAVVRHLHLGDQDLAVSFMRKSGWMTVAAAQDSDFIHAPATDIRFAKVDAKPFNIRFQSGVQGTKPISDAKGNIYGLRIPLPPVEVVVPSHELPAPGSRPAQIKILSTKYGKNQLTLTVTGPAGSTSTLFLKPEQVVAKLKLDLGSEKSGSAILSIVGPRHEPMLIEPFKLDLHFPKGEGWQTLEFTLTW